MSTQKNSEKKTYKPNKVFFIILIIVAVLFGGRILINYLNREIPTESQGVPVKISEVENTNFEKYFEIYGSALAETESTIITKVPANVETIKVKPGDQVKPGDTLFTMSTEDLEASMKQSQAAYEIAKNNIASSTGVNRELQIKQQEASMKSAEINFEDAKSNLERMKALYESGGVSKKDLETMESSYNLAKNQYEVAKKNYDIATGEGLTISNNIANAQLKQAEAGYEASKKQYDDMVVKSDIKGEVGISKVTVGEMAPTQGVAMTIVDYDNILFDVSVTEDKISKITKDSKCEVRFSALEGKVFNGEVVSVSPSIDPQTRLYQVQIKVSNSEKLIKPGMSGNIRIYEKSLTNTLAIPIDAIIETEEGSFIFVASSDSKAIRKTVEILDRNSSFALIGTGLSPGESLIVKGQDYLNDGDLINIAE